MSRRGGLGVWIFLCLILLVVVVVGVVIFLRGRDVPVSPESVGNVSFFNLSVGVSGVGVGERVSYSVRNDSGLLLEGFLFGGVQELFSVGVPENSSVNLSAWSSSFYWNVSVCNVSFNDFPCGVGVKRKASNYSLFLNGSELLFDVSGGVLQVPRVCFGEFAGVVDVVVPLRECGVPSDLRYVVDFCYCFDVDVNDSVVLPLGVVRNPFFNGSGLLSVVVRDFEVDGFSNVGDVWVSARID